PVCHKYLSYTHIMTQTLCIVVTTAYSMLPLQSLILFGSVFLTLNLTYDSNSPVHSSKGTPSPINGLRLLVGTRFQVLFHSPSGVLFTFPSRYWLTIGH